MDNKITMGIYANNLRECLVKRNMSQFKLHRITGIYPSPLSLIACGKMKCYPRWKHRIAEALEMSVEEIFPESEIE